jgi:hypothetical protein
MPTIEWSGVGRRVMIQARRHKSVPLFWLAFDSRETGLQDWPPLNDPGAAWYFGPGKIMMLSSGYALRDSDLVCGGIRA